MRAVWCVLLLSGLVAGLAEGYYLKGVSPHRFSFSQQLFGDSQENSKGNEVFSSSSSSSSSEDDKSFIAEEDTKEGQLWASDDDPDWTPSESEEDYSNEDDYTQEEDDYTHEDDDYTHEDYTQEEDDDYTHEDYTQEEDDDYTHEDYTQEDDDYTHEDYTQEDDDYTHEDYTQEEDDDYTQEDYTQEEQDYTHEDYTQEDNTQEEQDYTHEDYSQEDYSQEDYIPQNDDGQDQQPFPEVIPEVVLGDTYNSGAVKQHPGWPPIQQNKPIYFPLRHKRDVQSRYQTGQVVQVPASYQNEQYRPEVSTGVEPLLPVGGPPQDEVAEGVEPVLGDKDEESGGSSIGGWFREGWRRFTGKVEDVGDAVEDAAGVIHMTLYGLARKMSDLVKRFKAVMKKFGLVVQEGIRYCLRRFEYSLDQARESEVIEKLEKKLEEGHAEVALFFQILGEKIKAWRQQHASENIDTGLIEGYTQEGQDQLEEGPHTQNIQQNIPDFFQDPQVLVQLNKLEEEGVLTQGDIIILTQEHSFQDQQQNQDQQNQQQNQDQQNQQQNYPQQSQFNPEFIQFPH